MTIVRKVWAGVLFLAFAVAHVLVPHAPQGMNTNLRVCDNLASDVAAFVKEAAAKAISSKGQFVVALSGGSLPNSLLSLVNDESVQFSKWHVVFVDERYVALDHADSNFLACAALLARVPPKQVSSVKHAIFPHFIDGFVERCMQSTHPCLWSSARRNTQRFA